MKRLIIIASGVACLVSMALPLHAGLVFQMDFNDAEGNPSLLDRATTGVTGSFTGGAAYSNNVPPVNRGGYSGSFDGSSGAADFGDIDALDGLSAFTFTAWVRQNSAGENGSGRIFTKRSGSGPELYYHSADNELELVADGAGTTIFNGGGAIAVEWVFIAVTWTGGTATFYTGDGTTLSAGDADTGTAQTLSATTASLLIGNIAADTRAYDGLIDNVRIYDTVENTTSLESIMKFNDATVSGYQSNFDTATDLASAGMAKSAGAAGGSWEIDADKLVGIILPGGNNNARSSVYTTDSWRNYRGFVLNVTFWGSSALVRHSFGIVDAAWNVPADGDWLNQSYVGAYGIGFSTAGEAGADGLYFNNDAGTLTTLSTAQGDKTSAAAETMSITVTSTNWSYSLNGAAATTGLHSFDTSRSYRFIGFAQSTARANFSSIILSPIRSLGLWTGINGATWDASSTANFANNAYNAGLNNTTFDVAKAAEDRVTFADHYWDNSTNTVVSQNSVTIAAGGVSVGNVDFQNNDVDYTISGADATGITGTTALTINGIGTVTLSTANTYSGGTTLNDGTLIVNNNEAIGTGTLTLHGGTLRTGSTGASLDEPVVVSGTTAVFAASAELGLNGAISGVGTLNVGGSGSGQGAGQRVNLAINILNGFTGTLNLDNSENYIDIRGANTSAKLMTSGATSGEHIRLWGHSTFSELSGTGGFIAGDGAYLTINQSTDTTYAGRLGNVNSTRTGGLTKNGSGTLTMTGPNDYKRSTTINAGTLQLGDGGTAGQLNGVSSISIAAGATFAINQSDTVTQGTQFSTAAITGAGNFEQNGTGTTILNAANTYSGTTTVDAGTLLVNNTSGSGTGSGTVNVNTNATLGGTGTIAGLVTVNSGGHVSPGASSGDTLTLSGGLTLNDGAILDIAVDATGANDDLISITGGTLTGAGTSEVTVNVTLSSRKPGTYTLMDWTGAAETGVDTEDFSLICSESGNFSLTVSGKKLLLHVTGVSVFKFQ